MGSLEELPLLVPRRVFGEKVFENLVSPIVWVLAHANASSLQNDVFIFISSEVKEASGATVLRC